MRNLILLITGLLLLSACATGTYDRTNLAGSYEELSEDEQNIAAINRQARLRGVDVIWVHPPGEGEATDDDTEEEEQLDK